MPGAWIAPKAGAATTFRPWARRFRRCRAAGVEFAWSFAFFKLANSPWPGSEPLWAKPRRFACDTYSGGFPSVQPRPSVAFEPPDSWTQYGSRRDWRVAMLLVCSPCAASCKSNEVDQTEAGQCHHPNRPDRPTGARVMSPADLDAADDSHDCQDDFRKQELSRGKTSPCVQAGSHEEQGRAEERRAGEGDQPDRHTEAAPIRMHGTASPSAWVPGRFLSGQRFVEIARLGLTNHSVRTANRGWAATHELLSMSGLSRLP